MGYLFSFIVTTTQTLPIYIFWIFHLIQTPLLFFNPSMFTFFWILFKTFVRYLLLFFFFVLIVLSLVDQCIQAICSYGTSMHLLINEIMMITEIIRTLYIQNIRQVCSYTIRYIYQFNDKKRLFASMLSRLSIIFNDVPPRV